MGKIPNRADSATRQHLLQAALKCFARCGYAAASVQDIVDAAQVSKPALYYHFGDKAHLFQALMDHVHDERYRLMQAAAAARARRPAKSWRPFWPRSSPSPCRTGN